MSKYYDKTAASFKSVTIDTKVLDAQKILINSNPNDINQRENLLDVLNEIDVTPSYTSYQYIDYCEKSSNTGDCSAVKLHANLLPHGKNIKAIRLDVANTVATETWLVAYLVDANNNFTSIGKSINSNTWSAGDLIEWEFEEAFQIPEGSYLQFYIADANSTISATNVTRPSYKIKLHIANESGSNPDSVRYDGVWYGSRRVYVLFKEELKLDLSLYLDSKLGTITDELTNHIGDDTHLTEEQKTLLSELIENQGIDYVVETGVSNNNWYRIYKSGWVEQGGVTTTGSSGTTERTVALPIELKTSNYFVQLTQTGYYNATYAYQVKDLTTTSFKVYTHTGGVQLTAAMWEAKGLRNITNDIIKANGYIPNASSWNSSVFVPNNLTITRVENEVGYNGSTKSIIMHTSLIEDGSNLMNDIISLTSWDSDLSSLTNGYNMFYSCVLLDSFSGSLKNLTNGYTMFYGTTLIFFNSDLSSLTNGCYMFKECRLNTASIQNIADTIKDVTELTNSSSSSGDIYKQIDISIGNSTPTTELEGYFNTIASKGWTVLVNGSAYTPTGAASIMILDEDSNEVETPIPYYAKPVPSDEESATYTNADGNYFNIVGGQFIYGDDLSTYGMFTCEEDAAFNMGLTKIDK